MNITEKLNDILILHDFGHESIKLRVTVTDTSVPKSPREIKMYFLSAVEVSFAFAAQSSLLTAPLQLQPPAAAAAACYSQ